VLVDFGSERERMLGVFKRALDVRNIPYQLVVEVINNVKH